VVCIASDVTTRKMTSFCFPKNFLCFRVRVKVKVKVRVRIRVRVRVDRASVRVRARVRVEVRVRVSGNTFKNVFGQTSIWTRVYQIQFAYSL